jgi:hypothetical protein
MSAVFKEPNFMLIDLTDNVWVNTLIPSANHAALRCGFAGYPVNPRWSAAKFKAWKTGRQWREALAQGEMAVRSHDSMLVPVSELHEDSLEEKEAKASDSKPVASSNHSWFKFPLRPKQILAAFHAVS